MRAMGFGIAGSSVLTSVWARLMKGSQKPCEAQVFYPPDSPCYNSVPLSKLEDTAFCAGAQGLSFQGRGYRSAIGVDLLSSILKS